MKEFLENNIERIRTVLLITIIILLLIIIYLVVMDTDCVESKSTNNTNNLVIKEETKKIQEELVIEKVRVDIKGAIKKSGVYEIDVNSRIIDVLKLAGGLKSNASTKYINLSKKVVDEMVIYIYTTSEVKKLNIKSNQECKSDTEDIKECYGSTVVVPNKNDDVSTSNKISINKASKEELMTLNGIGEAKALDIIKYREDNGGFKTIEELLNVSGIGESLYNKIKDYITI